MLGNSVLIKNQDGKEYFVIAGNKELIIIQFEDAKDKNGTKITLSTIGKEIKENIYSSQFQIDDGYTLVKFTNQDNLLKIAYKIKDLSKFPSLTIDVSNGHIVADITASFNKINK